MRHDMKQNLISGDECTFVDLYSLLIDKETIV